MINSVTPTRSSTSYAYLITKIRSRNLDILLRSLSRVSALPKTTELDKSQAQVCLSSLLYPRYTDIMKKSVRCVVDGRQQNVIAKNLTNADYFFVKVNCPLK